MLINFDMFLNNVVEHFFTSKKCQKTARHRRWWCGQGPIIDERRDFLGFSLCIEATMNEKLFGKKRLELWIQYMLRDGVYSCAILKGIERLSIFVV